MLMDSYGLFWIDMDLKEEILTKMKKKEIIYDIPPIIKDERYRGGQNAER